MLRMLKYWTLLLLLVLSAQNSIGVEADEGGFTCKPDMKLDVCISKEYSKFDFPLNKEIKISIEISEVVNVNDKEFSITFGCYLNVQWKENRLRLSSEFGRKQAGRGINATMIPDIYAPINVELIKYIWLPDIYIYNLKTYKVGQFQFF